jgi:hypothetical protein
MIEDAEKFVAKTFNIILPCSEKITENTKEIIRLLRSVPDLPAELQKLFGICQE